MFEISKEFDFTGKTSDIVGEYKYGKEWPVVYLLYNQNEVYIGETVDAKTRLAQHYKNINRRSLKSVVIISNKDFNRSVTQDLEAYLISRIAADSRFSRLQNGNSGFRKHAYFRSKSYEDRFNDVWNELRKLKLARKSVKTIENSNIFKYSPYKTLTASQYIFASQIIQELAADYKKNKESTFLINGKPGTGKTVLGIFLAKTLASRPEDMVGLEDEEITEALQQIHDRIKNPSIGIVISMENLRAVIKNTFRHTYGLNEGMVLSPSEVANSKRKFDLLIVDEAHRLRQRKNLINYKTFDECNKKLGLDSSGTELDWILKKSKRQIFLYDGSQSIRKTDVEPEKILNLKKRKNFREKELTAQVRCWRGGSRYIQYINDIFSHNPPESRELFNKYDLTLFNDVEKMVSSIRKKDKELELCRTLAGYSWNWGTNGKLKPEPKNQKETDKYIKSGLFDIEIDGHKYIWNVKRDGWLLSENSSNEIGCVHTIQGFDLNYAGVIIGNELKYSNDRGIYIDKENYKDINGKKSTDEKNLENYILNIYKVLCTRGILGTYIYACDEGLRKYLGKYIIKKAT